MVQGLQGKQTFQFKKLSQYSQGKARFQMKKAAKDSENRLKIQESQSAMEVDHSRQPNRLGRRNHGRGSKTEYS